MTASERPAADRPAAEEPAAERPAAERPAAGPPPRRPRSRAWVELPVLVVLTLVVAALVRTFLVQPFSIPSGSMENTLQVGDRVLVDKVSYRFGDISRGDIVVFDGVDSFTPEVHMDEPPNALLRALRGLGSALGLAPPDETDFIKRVVGLPGDRVRCCDAQDRVTVNGQPLDESAYLYAGDEPSESPFDVVVPPGRIWVMGDHRSASADSRAHTGDPGGGTVAADKVIGRAFSVVWPLDRLTGLDVPAAYHRLRSPEAAVGKTAAVPSYALLVGALSPCVVVRRRRGSGTEGRRL